MVKSRSLTERQRAVLDTIRMNLSNKDGVFYLKQEYEIEISDSTYRREKRKLNKNKLQRLYLMARIGFEDQHMDAYDDLVTVKSEMWKNYHKEDDPLKRTIILEKIVNILPYLTSYYEATKEVIANRPEFKQKGNMVPNTQSET